MSEMQILFIADPLETFIKDHDSTWALMKAARRAGHDVSFARATSLGFAAVVFAELIACDDVFFASQLAVNKLVTIPETYQPSLKNIDSFDYIFMRQDPPVDAQYIYHCQLLAQTRKAKVLNDANAIIKHNEKLCILAFPDLISPTLVAKNKKQILAFIDEHKKVVLKPLDGKGGEAIFLAELGDPNLASIIEQLSAYGTKLIMAQKYIDSIKTQGDKRIIIVNGKILGAVLRVPSAGDHRANMAAGGTVQKLELSSRDQEIAEAVGQWMLEQNIFFAGIDVIGEYLTEINITSPTMLQEINRLEALSEADSMEAQIIRELGK